jgi:gas vesicle protein
MSDNRTDALMAFLLGAAVGAGVALLLAPQSGEETRKKLGETARRLGDDLDDKVRSAREEVKHRAGDVKAAIGAGREAYARARTGEEPSSTSNVM